VTVNSTQAITIDSAPTNPPIVGQQFSLGLTYAAIGTTGASAVVRISVNWGDGRTENFTGTPSSISHAYSAQGIYLVVVTGFDALDDTSTASKSITVAPRPLPTVSFTVSDNPTVNAVVTFTINATATGAGSVITSVAIDFGDGKSTTLSGAVKTVQHVYTSPSPPEGYTVTVTATDSTGASASASAVLVVK